MVISKEQEEGYHLAYAVLNPKKGLLHMPYEMGRSKKKTYLSLLKYAIIFSVCMCIISSVIVLIQYFSGDFTEAQIKRNLIISYPVSIIFPMFCMSLFLLGKNNLKK